MRHRLQAFASSYVAPQPNAWRSLFSFVSHHAMVSAVVFLVFTGATLSALAENALPGNPLYGIKTEVNDRIQTALTFDDESRLNLELQQIDRSLSEETQAADQVLHE